MSVRRYTLRGTKIEKPKNQDNYVKALTEMNISEGNVLTNIMWQRPSDYCDIMITLVLTPYSLEIEHYHEGYQIELTSFEWNKPFKVVDGIKTDKEMLEIAYKFIKAKPEYEEMIIIFN